MKAMLFPTEMQRTPPVTTRRLSEIATVLGVPVNAFTGPAEPYFLYANEDGVRWLLEFNDQDMPIVRRDGSAAGLDTAGESIQNFLARDVGSPQHQSLSALIECLLVMHLARR